MKSNLIREEAERIISSVDFSSLKNKSVLITGASGLVGVFLVAALRKAKSEQNTHVSVWVNREFPDYLAGNFDFCHTIRGDITEAWRFTGMPKFDCIIHCSGYGQPQKFVVDKIKTIKINTEATINLFSLLKPNGSFLFVSSSEVYNGLSSDMVTEEMIGTTDPSDARSCYIEGKRCGESICHAFSEKGFNVKIARLAPTYGPGTRMDDKRVMSELIRNGLQNPSINLLDSGKAIRTYSYVTDAVTMMWNILLHGKSVVYNIGGDTTISILDLATAIGTILGKPVKVPSEDNSLKGSPLVMKISSERYHSEFGKMNLVQLDYGLKKTIHWHR